MLATLLRPERRCYSAFTGGGEPPPSGAVINPTEISFTASLDHDTLVTGYTMQFFVLVGDVGPASDAIDLGKPTPVGGVITVTLVLTDLPSSSTTEYTAYITSVGDDGSSVSEASNNFKVVR